MNSQELRSIQEAYLEVVENQQLDEITASMGRRAKEYNRKKEQDAHMARQKDHQDKMKNDPEYAAKRRKIDAAASSRMGKGNPRYDASAAGSSRVKGFKFTPTEEVSVYDIVLSHLLDEGYADTVESAEGIMINMSEEWRDSIVEGQQLGEAMSSYDRNRKRAAQRAADRNAARAAGKTGVVPGVGYVSPRKERETYTDEKGTVRHKSGAKMP